MGGYLVVVCLVDPTPIVSLPLPGGGDNRTDNISWLACLWGLVCLGEGGAFALGCGKPGLLVRRRMLGSE